MSNLETRIADALNDSSTSAKLLSKLLLEIDAALPINAKEVEVTRVRMVDPAYPNPAIAKSALETLELEKQRLNAAIPIMQERFRKADRHERVNAYKITYNSAIESHNECSQILGKLYKEFVEAAIPLLETAIKVNANSRSVNAHASAKGFSEFPTIPMIAEMLIDKMVLPASYDQNYWPKHDNQLAVAYAESTTRHYSPRYSADWAEARKLDDQRKLAEWAKHNEIFERQQAEAKKEFEQSKMR